MSTPLLQVAGLVGEVGVFPAGVDAAPAGWPLHPGLLDSGAAGVFCLASVQTPLLNTRGNWIILAKD